jgi:hypothetical protein
MKTKLKKPQKKTSKYFDYGECRDFINKKYHIDIDDYANHFASSNKWCKDRGELPANCPPGCSSSQLAKSQAQFARYQSDVAAGKWQEPPFQCFWHFILDACGIGNGSEFWMDGLDPKEAWQQEILDLFLKEFGSGPYVSSW